MLRQGILTSSALTSLLLNDFCQYSYSHYTVMVTIYLRGNLVLFFGGGGGGAGGGGAGGGGEASTLQIS